MKDIIRPKSFRVLILERDPFVRRCLARLIDLEPDLEGCGGAAGVAEALERIRELRPDVVVVNADALDGRGPDAIGDLRWKHPALPLLVVSLHGEAVYGR